MADTHEFITGFPTAWSPFYDTQAGQEQVYSLHRLHRILGAMQVSIHRVINDAGYRWAAQQLYKALREVERREKAADEKAFQEWILWCRSLGCPI